MLPKFSRKPYTVQLTAKFTPCVIFSHVQFKALVKTRMPHTGKPTAHVGLVHASLRLF